MCQTHTQDGQKAQGGCDSSCVHARAGGEGWGGGGIPTVRGMKHLVPGGEAGFELEEGPLGGGVRGILAQYGAHLMSSFREKK